MLIQTEIGNGLVTFSFICEEDDIEEFEGHRLHTNSFSFVLPSFISGIEHLHPDKWAIIVMLVLFNYVGNNLVLPFHVSRELHDFFGRCGKNVVPFSETVVSCVQKRFTRDGICYSGGVNSTILSTILGNTNTVLVHLGKLDASYSADYDYAVLDSMQSNGYEVYQVLSDLHLVAPLFDSLCFGVGVILLSDYLELGQINFGCVLNDILSLGERFKKITVGKRTLYMNDYENYCDSWSFWKKLFGLIGLTLQFPIACLTEITTQLAISKSLLKNKIDGCDSHLSTASCDRCDKCIRLNVLKNHSRSDLLESYIFENVYREINLPLSVVLHVYETDPWLFFWLYYLPEKCTISSFRELSDLYSKKNYLTDINEGALNYFQVNPVVTDRIREIVKIIR